MSEVKLSLFSQILSLIDRDIFSRTVRDHRSDKFCKGINTWTHLVSMIFMQMSAAGSLRDISTGLLSATGNLNHMGVQRAPSKSSLSYLNKNRDYKVFESLYFALLERLEPSLAKARMYAARLKRQIFIIDSSIIPLSLSLFDWAKFRTTKGAIKLHAVLDFDSGLPNYAVITEGRRHDVKVAKGLIYPAGSVLVMDRAYVDYAWLFNLDSNGVYFVTRLKSNSDFHIIRPHPGLKPNDHILDDQIIQLSGYYSQKSFPGKLRVVTVYDPENDQTLYLLTNHLSWTADTIAQLYRSRWAVEVFFKHLKQLFRVKSFVGTSENAVKIQMWCSMIAILLLSYLKSKAKFKWQLSNLITFLRINLFVKIELWHWLNDPFYKPPNSPPSATLFNL